MLGKIGDSISGAMPPPPNWDEVADKIGDATVRHLSDWAGDVPEPPSKEEIQANTNSPLPQLDTSTQPLEPTVPDEYNKGKITFDLNNAPEIPIKDESKPFRIDDPIANQKHDPPGTPVIPGDPRNSSDGIKTPDRIDTGDNTPKPGKIIFELPRPTPKPDPTTSPTPVPLDKGGGAATPIPTDGPIPIPKGGAE